MYNQTKNFVQSRKSTHFWVKLSVLAILLILAMVIRQSSMGNTTRQLLCLVWIIIIIIAWVVLMTYHLNMWFKGQFYFFSEVHRERKPMRLFSDETLALGK